MVQDRPLLREPHYSRQSLANENIVSKYLRPGKTIGSNIGVGNMKVCDRADCSKSFQDEGEKYKEDKM
jgi:hypothetical protein